MYTTTSPTRRATNPRTRKVREIMRSPAAYALYGTAIAFRPYQDAPIRAILDSIIHHYGDTIVIIFPRQSGKDEFLVNLKLYLLDLFSVVPAGIVEVNPTYKPQTQTAILRFDNALKRHPFTRGKWQKKGDFMRLLGYARLAFLSGDAKANVVGATASLALIVNEAQDIYPRIYHGRFEPMAASANATRILAGTVWTSNTLLAQERRAALAAQKRDGRRRVFMIDTNDVRQYVPWYGQHVDGVIAKIGRQHPFVKTQYFNEEIDANAGMFNAARMALTKTKTKPHDAPRENARYAFLLDVAGQDEAAFDNAQTEELQNAQRDSVTLSIVEIDLATIQTQKLPAYTVVHRREWTGRNHLDILGKIKALAQNWQPSHLVIDASGVGEGLWALCDRNLKAEVIPVKFSPVVKSEIGWGFLSIIETGRFKDAVQNDRALKQYTACVSEIKPGPAKLLRWSVPENARDENGLLIHDDHLLADALVAQLDKLDWSFATRRGATIIHAPDPLEKMDRNY